MTMPQTCLAAYHTVIRRSTMYGISIEIDLIFFERAGVSVWRTLI